jgi:hypothetical protein
VGEIRNWRTRYVPGACAGIFLSSLFVGLSLSAAVAQANPAAAPKMQLPADQRAYQAALNTPDPAQRITALEAFLKDYPRSDRAARARGKIFSLTLDHFPVRTKAIDKLAKEQVKEGGKQKQSRYATESDVAEKLAEAGPNGIDLAQAEKWARQAVDKQSEPEFDKTTIALYKKFKVPAPKPTELHKQYEDTLQGYNVDLADVYLHEGKLPEAKSLLDQAYAVQPLDSDTNAVRGELALLQHDAAGALTDFERAELSGDLGTRWRTKLNELYAAAHNGKDTGMIAAMDAEYRSMFPPPFPPDKDTLKPGGHTALLELFTGSACPPCVGGDLAVDALLEQYPRTQLVALSFDEHIPEPDPLANPDTAARAELYHSRSTPNYVLDGKMLNIYGQGREQSKQLYDPLNKLVLAEAGLPTSVQLKLTAAQAAGGHIEAHATVTTGSTAELAKQIVFPPEPKPAAPEKAETKDTKKDAGKNATAAKKPESTPAGAVPAKSPLQPAEAAPAAPDLALNFALVEDDVRYSGQNGIRFHRYVVRALAKPADGGFAVAPDKTATLDASFDPAAISATLTTYLDDYAKHNEGFGPITFLSTDTTMQPSHLYVVAWVQDVKTHRVIDTAIVPVAPSAGATEGLAAPAAGGN